MQEGNRVKLRTFNGSARPASSVSATENYWLLVGRPGTIRRDPAEPDLYVLRSGARVCVEFDDDLSVLGLECHNPVKNALWILESDLEREM